MAFDLKSWKDKAARNFAEAAKDILSRSPDTLYYTLCAAALLPLAEMVAKGEGRPEVLIPAALGIAANVGTNLLADVVVRMNETPPEDQARLVAQAINDPEKGRATLAESDAILTKLDAIAQTKKAMSEEDGKRFMAEMARQARRIKSAIYIEGDANVGRDLIGRDKYTVFIENYFAGNGAERNKENLADVIEQYLRWVQVDCGEIAMRCEGETRQADPLEIGRAFVHLDLQKRGFMDEENLDIAAHRRLPQSEKDEVKKGAITTRDLLKQRVKLVLTGGPGCGKSTVAQALAWAFSTSLLNGSLDTASALFDLPGDNKQPFQCPLPILIPLARFADYRNNLSVKDDHSLISYIAHYLRERQVAFHLPDDFFAVLMKQNTRVMLLLDGLDEVVEADKRAEIAQVIGDLAKSREGLMMLVTCRSAAYLGRSTLSGNRFQHLFILPLTDEQTTAMVSQAYGDIFAEKVEEREIATKRLLSGIRDLEEQRRARMGKSYERFVDSPLIVRMLLIVDYNDRKLPNQRALLYERVIANMISPDYHRDDEVIAKLNRQIGEHHIELMRAAAFAMHSAGEAQGKFITQQDLKRALQTDGSFDAGVIEAFVKLINRRDTLLSERGGVYRFIHLSFQEHLAAQYVQIVKGDEGGLKGVASYLHQPDAGGAPPVLQSWWREPILLIFGQLGTPDRAGKLLRELANFSPDEPALHLASLELAASAWLELSGAREDARAELAKSLKTAYENKPLMSRAPAVLRAAAGRALARLGDPRKEAISIAHMPFCKIPAGPFTMGADDESDNKKRRVDIAYDYWMSRWPVTNAQFDEFVRDDGYTKPEYKNMWVEAQELKYWQAGRGYSGGFDEGKFRTGPRQYGEPFGLPNHPVVGVSWHEALAFTRWLTHKYSDVLFQKADGTHVRATLPTEAEWEKAARGTKDERKYAWGNEPDAEKMNIDKTGIGATSAVGCFPKNDDREYECEEMNGNVWEWCVDQYQKPLTKPRITLQDRQAQTDYFKRAEIRVLRGGSWFSDDGSAVSSYRSFNFPFSFLNNLGFRVVLVASPLHSEL